MSEFARLNRLIEDGTAMQRYNVEQYSWHPDGAWITYADAEAGMRKARAEGRIEGLREALQIVLDDRDWMGSAALLRLRADEAEGETL